MITSAAVKSKATELGFDLCGIAPVDDFPELLFLPEWLARGYAGEMAYMSRSADRRADVRAVLAGAQSVIVTGTVYGVEPTTGNSAPREQASDSAIIARYAWGDDYHDVLKARLDLLLAWMRAESSEAFEARAYVDTGPVQERVYAQYAGLGWIGKNTCLINAGVGSWLFLAEIICTLPLDPDAEALEQCGTCRRCLDACPTGALVEAGVLDSTRCISYLTIELRTGIPESHRAAIGNRVYGCDICQDVCPYNQPSAVSRDPAWRPRAGLELPRLVELWQRSDPDLVALAKGTAITRAKLTGLRRNLAVAIGNCGDEDARAALTQKRADQASTTDPMVRAHIDWAVSRRVP